MARYELTDTQYKRIEDLFSGKKDDVDLSDENNRTCSSTQRRPEKNSIGIEASSALIDCSCRCLDTNIHILVDALGNPCRILLSQAQEADISFAGNLIDSIRLMQ